jgi:ribosomal protein S18 acetylase RimI-like enzyme
LSDQDVTIRPLADGELELFLALDPAGEPVLAPPSRDFLATAADRHYRPEWTWIAQRGDRVVARAAWWGGPDDDHPSALDWLDVARDGAHQGMTGPDGARQDIAGPSVGPGAEADRVRLGARLLRAAHEAGTVRTASGELAAFHLFLPPDWHDRPDIGAAVELRIAAAGQAGLHPFVERLRLEWEASAGVPAGSGRLRFGPMPDDPGLLDLLERVNVGTLDAHARRDLDREGPAAAARTQLDDMRWMPSPESLWCTASTPAGELVGLVVPSRNYQSAVIGYVGVVPEQRGHGYVDDLLAEGTARLAAEGAELIRADTDVGNAPMAAAFARAGYRVTARRIVMA